MTREPAPRIIFDVARSFPTDRIAACHYVPESQNVSSVADPYNGVNDARSKEPRKVSVFIGSH